jgi:hypothetical protein
VLATALVVRNGSAGGGGATGSGSTENAVASSEGPDQASGNNGPDADTAVSTADGSDEAQASTVDEAASTVRRVAGGIGARAIPLLGQLTTAFVGFGTPSASPGAVSDQALPSTEELEEAIETLKAEQTDVTNAWVAIIEDLTSTGPDGNDGWKRWAPPFHRFELAQLGLYEYPDTGVIGLNGPLLRDAELAALRNRIGEYNAAFNVNEVRVDGGALAQIVRDELRAMGVEGVDVSLSERGGKPVLKIQFTESNAHTRDSVTAFASRFVFDQQALFVQAF